MHSKGFCIAYPHLDYNSRSDEICMVNKEKVITSSDIFELLKSTVCSENLSDYVREILDTYEEKEILIDNNFDNRRSNIKIIEEPKRLVLVPKKITYKKMVI